MDAGSGNIFQPKALPEFPVGPLLFSRPESAEGMVGMETAVRSDKTLKRYYRIINRKFFNDELPNNVCVRYVNEDDTDEEERCEENYFGWTEEATKGHSFVIVISKAKNPGPTMTGRCATLAHEMIHVMTWNQNLKDDHGKTFSDWHETLTKRGLFRKGAVLRSLTLF